MIRVAVTVAYDEETGGFTIVETEIEEVYELQEEDAVLTPLPFTKNEAFLGNLLLVAGEKVIQKVLATAHKPNVVRLRLDEIYAEAVRLTDISFAENQALGNLIEGDENGPNE